MNLFITGIFFIILYFALYHVMEKRKNYRRSVFAREMPKSYLAGIFVHVKEEIIISAIWVFLVIGIFLCLSYILLEIL